jgi:hypothetical protein
MEDSTHLYCSEVSGVNGEVDCASACVATMFEDFLGRAWLRALAVIIEKNRMGKSKSAA